MKKYLHIKGNNCESEETAFRMVENLCQLFIGQEITVRINKLKNQTSKE
jgi:hypothetical protein